MVDRVARVVGKSGGVPVNQLRVIEGSYRSEGAIASAPYSPFKDIRLHVAVAVIICGALGYYVHNQHACQQLKGSGKFYFGMSVDRCIGVLNRAPLQAFTDPLAALDAWYEANSRSTFGRR